MDIILLIALVLLLADGIYEIYYQLHDRPRADKELDETLKTLFDMIEKQKEDKE